MLIEPKKLSFCFLEKFLKIVVHSEISLVVSDDFHKKMSVALNFHAIAHFIVLIFLKDVLQKASEI